MQAVILIISKKKKTRIIIFNSPLLYDSFLIKKIINQLIQKKKM